jgi:LDH2 family malate/lactate/ureidoglycolate dehydrogenase
MVEILSSALQDNAYLAHLPGGAGLPVKIGHFFLAIDIAHFISLERFKTITGGIMRDLRAAPTIPGQSRIYTAGEKEYEMEKKVRQQGVPVIPNLQKDIKVMQSELGLTRYQFPF